MQFAPRVPLNGSTRPMNPRLLVRLSVLRGRASDDNRRLFKAAMSPH